MVFQVKMSSLFWDYFVKLGRKKMYEYNRKYKTDMRVIREKLYLYPIWKISGIFS